MAAPEVLIEVNKYTVVGQNARLTDTVHIGSISKVSETVGKKVNGQHTQLYDVIDLYGKKILTTDYQGLTNVKNMLPMAEINKYIITGRRARFAGKENVKIPTNAGIKSAEQRRVVLNNAQEVLYDVVAASGAKLVITDQAGFDAINTPA